MTILAISILIASHAMINTIVDIITMVMDITTMVMDITIMAMGITTMVMDDRCINLNNFRRRTGTS